MSLLHWNRKLCSHVKLSLYDSGLLAQAYCTYAISVDVGGNGDLANLVNDFIMNGHR